MVTSADAVSALLELHMPPGTTNLEDTAQNTGHIALSNQHSYDGAPQLTSARPLQHNNASTTNGPLSHLERSMWLEETEGPHSPSSGTELRSAILSAANFENLATGSPNRRDPLTLNLNSQIPGWLVGDDFDLGALNSSIIQSATTLDWSHDIASSMTGVSPTNVEDILIESPANVITNRREDLIRRQWFTYLAPGNSGFITPEVLPEPSQVDERYRENLSRQLQPQLQNEPLPSTDFLVSYIYPLRIMKDKTG
jgi:hypothetical protein